MPIFEHAHTCFDETKQHYGVEKFCENAVHKTIKHLKEEFISKSDKSNIINDLKNDNK